MDDATRAFLAEVQAQVDRLSAAECWLYGTSVVQAFHAVYGWLDVADTF